MPCSWSSRPFDTTYELEPMDSTGPPVALHALLLATGLYLFVLPYATRKHDQPSTDP